MKPLLLWVSWPMSVVTVLFCLQVFLFFKYSHRKVKLTTSLTMGVKRRSGPPRAKKTTEEWVLKFAEELKRDALVRRKGKKRGLPFATRIVDKFKRHVGRQKGQYVVPSVQHVRRLLRDKVKPTPRKPRLPKQS